MEKTGIAAGVLSLALGSWIFFLALQISTECPNNELLVQVPLLESGWGRCYNQSFPEIRNLTGTPAESSRIGERIGLVVLSACMVAGGFASVVTGIMMTLEKRKQIREQQELEIQTL